jgi:hypothetical protein
VKVFLSPQKLLMHATAHDGCFVSSVGSHYIRSAHREPAGTYCYCRTAGLSMADARRFCQRLLSILIAPGSFLRLARDGLSGFLHDRRLIFCVSTISLVTTNSRTLMRRWPSIQHQVFEYKQATRAPLTLHRQLRDGLERHPR